MILLHHTIYLRSDAGYLPLFSIFSLSPQCEDFPYVISKLYSFYMMGIFFYLDSLFQLKICTMTLLISILIAFCMHLKENSKYSYSKNNQVMQPDFWNKLRDWEKKFTRYPWVQMWSWQRWYQCLISAKACS